MYSLFNVAIQSKEQLLKHISEEQILTFYFGEFDLNKLYLSPFRDEKRPSFIISYYNDKLVWRDFGTSNRPRGVIDFVCTKFNISFIEAINKILSEVVESNKIPITKRYIKNSGFNYQLKYSDSWLDWQLEYWSKGGIKISTLNKFNVKWCNELWFNNKLFSRGSKTNLMYYYDHSTVPFEESWTVYRPNAPFDKKFRKHNIDNKTMGLDLIPESGEILVITKSYKDIMVLFEIGIPAIAPHNENIPITKETIDNLKERFDHIYVNYDNDSTGVNSSIKFTKEHNLNYWNIPRSLNCKDPYECSCMYGVEKVFNLLNEKIKRDLK